MSIPRLHLFVLLLWMAPVVRAGNVNPQPGLPERLPVVVFDVDFNQSPVGLPPPTQSKEQIEAADAEPFWTRFPIRTCDALLWVTRTRRAVVAASAYGLEEKPVVLTYDESGQPQYGPQVVLTIPDGVAKVAGRYRLLLDVARNSQARSGGFTLDGVASVTFQEDGSVLAGKVNIARYQPSVPLHFEVILDIANRTATYVIDGRKEQAATVPWAGRGSFKMIRLDGVVPGFGDAPASIAFDNIKLILEGTL